MLKLLPLTGLLLYSVGHCTGLFFSEKHPDRNCFCELEGSINDCSCDVDTVDYFNNNKIFPRLKSLLVKDYFRFYRVHLNKGCPFWPDDSKCSMKFCSVNACEEKDIPEWLKGDQETESVAYKYTPDAQTSDCSYDHNEALSYLNTSLSQQAQQGFERWADYDEQEDNFCILDDHQDDPEYVDLLLNPERYTGYRGESAHRIWSSIYLENCFLSEESSSKFLSHYQQPLNDMCIEQRAFYRLISGLHTSISIHLSSNYLLSDKDDFMSPKEGLWGRNVDEFQRRFSPGSTNNDGPNWLRNLYFSYLIELRALAKAAPYLRNEQYFTGIEEEDVEVRTAIQELLTIIGKFPSHFNESLLFNGGDSIKLKHDFREKFRNISKIMDCVGCDKCRLWGKLQIQGLGTALKILFSGKFDQPTAGTVDGKSDFKLRRGEIVSLFNAFGRLSNSINQLEEFRKVLR